MSLNKFNRRVNAAILKGRIEFSDKSFSRFESNIHTHRAHWERHIRIKTIVVQVDSSPFCEILIRHRNFSPDRIRFLYGKSLR